MVFKKVRIRTKKIIIANISPPNLNLKKLISKKFSVEPLWIEYIKSNLDIPKKDVTLMDNILQKKSIEEVIREIKRINPRMLCLLFSQHSLKEVKEIVKKIKDKQIHITCMGIFPSLIGKKLFKAIKINSIIGDNSPETLNRLFKHINQAFKIKEVITKKKDADKIKKFSIRNLMNPIRDLTSLAILNKSPIALLSSQGCPWSKCTFCQPGVFNRKRRIKKWEGRKIKEVVKEVEDLIKKFKYYKFSFIDECFFGPGKNWMRKGYEFANLLREKKLEIEYSLDCRAEHVDKRLFNKMKKSGLTSVYIGIEAANTKSLCRINKGISLLQIKKALKICDDLKIKVFLGFIPFSYDYLFEEVKTNLVFLKDLKNFQKGVYTNIIVPLYDTKVWNKLNRKKGKYLYPTMKWKDKKVEILYKRLYNFSKKKESNNKKALDFFVNQTIKSLEEGPKN